jgi:hypothetical protein
MAFRNLSNGSTVHYCLITFGELSPWVKKTSKITLSEKGIEIPNFCTVELFPEEVDAESSIHKGDGFIFILATSEASLDKEMEKLLASSKKVDILTGETF